MEDFLLIAEAEGFEWKRLYTTYCKRLSFSKSKVYLLQNFNIIRIAEKYGVLTSMGIIPKRYSKNLGFE